eukprot:1110163-Rhodomonas_salina.1
MGGCRVKYGLDEIRRKFEGGMKPHDFPGAAACSRSWKPPVCPCKKAVACLAFRTFRDALG